MSGTTGMKLSMTRRLILVVALLMPVVLAGCATTGPALHQAALKGDVAAMKQLLAAGADINENAIWGTPLGYASWYCKPEAVSYLIQQGAHLEASRSGLNGLRPLHQAIYSGCLDVVRLLADAGADINSKPDKEYGSALIIAVDQGHEQIAKYLIYRGANLEEAITRSKSHVNSRKVTPILEKYRHEAIAEAVRKALEQKKEKEKAQIQEIENANLVGLLNVRPETGPQIEALTQALIRAKNTQIPGFIARSSVEERVNLLTTVELRISDAQALIARLNAQAEDAVRQGQSAAPLREEAGKVQTYAGILSAIRSMLLQS